MNETLRATTTKVNETLQVTLTRVSETLQATQLAGMFFVEAVVLVIRARGSGGPTGGEARHGKLTR